MRKKVIIITGPTGGHFFPGLAIGERLKEEDVKFFVPEREYIKNWLEKKNFKYKIIPSAKLTKKNFLIFPFKFLCLILLSIFLYLKEKPDLVIGTGSYVCVPFILGAKILNKKIIIHEQNFQPGKSTKILSPFVNLIFLTFPNKDGLPQKKCIITGFPLISEFYQDFNKQELKAQFNLKENRENILILGGSQGSSFINSLIKENLNYFKENNFQLIHIAGKEKEKIEKTYKEKQVDGIVFDFFYEMNKLYSISDYVMARAGAGTIVEICEKKIPAFLIPYPYAGGHQKKNAEYLEKLGCAFVMEENEKNRKEFRNLFRKFLENKEDIKENLKKIKLSENVEISEIIKNLMEKHGKERKFN